MFIETALKNIALNTIMTEIDSSSVYDMYDKAKYSLQGTTQSRYLTGGVPPVRFSM